MPGKRNTIVAPPTPNSSKSKGSAEFRTLTSASGFYRMSDIIKPGHCPNSICLKLKVTDKQKIKDGVYEFTFEEGKKIIRGVSFGEKVGAVNNQKLQVGYTYVVKAKPGTGIEIKTFDRKDKIKYKRLHFTCKYELILPILDTKETSVNRNGKKAVSKLEGISHLNKMIKEKGGKLDQTVKLSNVLVENCELYRYKGCSTCQTSIGTPEPNEKRLFCKKCRRKGGNILEPGKSKFFMTLRDFRFKDEDDNTLEGGIAFNSECENIVKKLGGDFLFDEQPKKIAEDALIGKKVNVTIKLQCTSKYRDPGDRSNLKIVVSKIEILASGNSNCEAELAGQGHDLSSSNNSDTSTVEEEPMEEDGSNDSEQFNGAKSEVLLPSTNMEEDSVSFGQPEYNESSQPQAPGNSSTADSNFYVPSVQPIGILPALTHEEAKAKPKVRQYSSKRLALLTIMNKKFPTEARVGDRDGAEHDLEKLKGVFSKNLDVILHEVYENVDSKRLKEILEDFKKRSLEKGADSIMINIMSHGNQNTLVMADGVPVNVYLDILWHFSDSRFPEFTGKPKIIFSLACRNFPRPEVVDRSERAVLQRAGYPFEAVDLLEHGFLLQDYSDVLVCFPQLSGNPVIRCKRSGTPFVHYLCQVLIKYSRTMHLRDLIGQVEKELRDFRRRDARFRVLFAEQVPQVESICFHDNFFFRRRDLPSSALSVPGLPLADTVEENAVMDFPYEDEGDDA